MQMHTILIDDEVWNFLKKFAEPFEDTPNSVIRRLLFKEDEEQEGHPSFSAIDIKGVPKALSQIFEVIYEIEINQQTRIEATRRVAERRGTAPQTVIDKYCRQLNKRAHEIDMLFDEPGYGEFQKVLIQKFINYQDIIEAYFSTLAGGIDSESEDPGIRVADLESAVES